MVGPGPAGLGMTEPRRLQTQGEAIAVLSTQMLQLHTDVEGLRQDLRNHRREHEEASSAQSSARRRLWSAVVVLVASIDGPLIGFMLTRR